MRSYLVLVVLVAVLLGILLYDTFCRAPVLDQVLATPTIAVVVPTPELVPTSTPGGSHSPAPPTLALPASSPLPELPTRAVTPVPTATPVPPTVTSTPQPPTPTAAVQRG